MKIVDLVATPIAVPLERTFGGSVYSVSTRCTIIVEIVTDEGISGRTYSGDQRDYQREVVEILDGTLRPMLIGADPFHIEEFWAAMWRQSVGIRSPLTRSLFVQAISAIDTAAWDLIGKIKKAPLYQLWGGSKKPIRVMVIGGYYRKDKTIGDLVQEVLSYQMAGAGGIKLKVGGLSPAEDLERLAAVRHAVGDEFWIACDANRGWELPDALAFAHRAIEYDIVWFEEPVVWFDELRGMREVRRKTGVPVCAGQSEIDLGGARALIDNQSVDFINFDASLGGGPTAWRELAAYAEKASVQMSHHEEAQLALHLLGSISHGSAVEVFEPQRDPVWHRMLLNAPQPVNGWLNPPDAPGFGLVLDADFIEKYAS